MNVAPGSHLAKAMALAAAPSKYDAYFQASGRKWGIDPKLLKAVACWESSLNPLALGYSGDTGLMQVTRNGLGRVPSFLPGTNVDQGAEILSGDLNRSGGDIATALALYNGGHVSTTTRLYAQNVQQVYGVSNA